MGELEYSDGKGIPGRGRSKHNGMEIGKSPDMCGVSGTQDKQRTWGVYEADTASDVNTCKLH